MICRLVVIISTQQNEPAKLIKINYLLAGPFRGGCNFSMVCSRIFFFAALSLIKCILLSQ